MLGDRSSAVRWSAAEALGKIGDPRAVEQLIKALEDGEASVQWHAADALGEIGDLRAVDPLISVLGNGDSGAVRQSAADALGKIGDALAVEPLIRALEDSNCAVRKNAARALGEIGDTRAVKPLLNRCLEEMDMDVRKGASEALEKIGILERIGIAADALGKMGDARAVEALIEALGNSKWDVRMYAAWALGRIGDTYAVEPLIQLLINDHHSDVRECAAEALDKLHWSPASETEKAYYLTAKQDWDAVVSLGASSAEPLMRLLEDKNSDIRNGAMGLLEQIFPQITEITFGEIPSNNSRNTIKNIDISHLTIPMSSLTKININAETYDFDMVERFITYSINYVGQKHLRKKVEVYIHGNPEKLHPNLLNSFKNLCRKVIFL